MNSENSKKSSPRGLVLTLTEKKVIYPLYYQILAYYMWKSIKKPYKTSKLKLSRATQGEELELPDGSYSVPDIQNHFEVYHQKV